MEGCLETMTISASFFFCVGFFSYLLAVAVHDHKKVGIAVFSIILTSMIVGSAYIYITFYFMDSFLCSELRRHLSPLLGTLRLCQRGSTWLLGLPLRHAGKIKLQRPWCRRNSTGTAAPLPEFAAVAGETRGMAVLTREPPVRARAAQVVVVVDDIPAYEKRDNVRGEDTSVECSVCLCEVENGETVKKLPVCLHMFHKECIDLWLKDNLTCPLCRDDVFAQIPAAQMA